MENKVKSFAGFKKFKKLIILLILIFASGVSVYAQESKEKSGSIFDRPFFDATDFFFGLTPTIYISTSESTQGAVSPISFPVYFGIEWPNDNWFSFQPSVKIFTGYYLVEDGQVLPAEVENRTALAFNLLLNVPVVFQANFWENSNLRLSAGIAFLFRFAILASDVGANDYGYTGSASGDVAMINKWFYSGLKFLYLTGGADWLFKLNEYVMLGPEVSINFPLGMVISNFSLEGTIISVGVKVVF